jgi:hypothetical protein
MTRERLPDARYSETFDVVHAVDGVPGAVRVVMTVGYYPDGRPGEVFVKTPKAAATAYEAIARDFGIAISLLLQHGVAAATIQAAFTKEASGKPSSLGGAIAEALT